MGGSLPGGAPRGEAACGCRVSAAQGVRIPAALGTERAVLAFAGKGRGGGGGLTGSRAGSRWASRQTWGQRPCRVLHALPPVRSSHIPRHTHSTEEDPGSEEARGPGGAGRRACPGAELCLWPRSPRPRPLGLPGKVGCDAGGKGRGWSPQGQSRRRATPHPAVASRGWEGPGGCRPRPGSPDASVLCCLGSGRFRALCACPGRTWLCLW